MRRYDRIKAKLHQDQQKQSAASIRRQEEARAAELSQKAAAALVEHSQKEREHFQAFIQGLSPSDTAYLVRKAKPLFKGGNAPMALQNLFRHIPIRPVQEWKPVGKSQETLLRSLINHVIPTFPMPTILHSVFWADDTPAYLQDIAVEVARGASLVEIVKAGRLSIPLTRKMCHEVLKVAGGSFIEAIRWVQIKTAGGNSAFHRAWMGTRYGRQIRPLSIETFWQTVIDWIAKQAMFDYRQVGPLCDFIEMRRGLDPNFSMRGRAVVPLFREMEAWHAELNEKKAITSYKSYPVSGYENATYDESVYAENGLPTKHSIWRVREILSTKDLVAEGRAMSHCVYSYESAVLSGNTSIWSLTHEDGKGETGNWRMLTIEVINSHRSVVQIRGRFNRKATVLEQIMVERWAKLNGLAVRHYA